MLHRPSSRPLLCAAVLALPLLITACGEAPQHTGQADLAPQIQFPDSGPAPDDTLPTPGDGAPAPDAALPAPDATPPPPPPSFSFVVFGDNQFATTSCTSGVPERLAVPAAVMALKPDLVLHTGNLMDHGYDAGAYAKFASCYSKLLAKLPFFPTMGNHDAGYTGVKNYKAYLKGQLFSVNPKVVGQSAYAKAFSVTFNDDPTAYSQSFSSPSHLSAVPSGVSFKTFYAFSHKNAYFISFEQGTRWWTNTPKPWLEKHLKQARANPAIQHIFVHMHHPLYSSTMAENTSGECIGPVRKHYEALFRKYDVTVVFSGHAHLYDRFYVPDDGHATRKDPPPKTYPGGGQAIHYIVTGGGGGGLNSCNTLKKEKSYAFFQRRFCVHHVTRVQVSGKQLTISAVKVQGSASSYSTKVVDSFVVQ